MLSLSASQMVRSELNVAISPLLDAYRAVADDPRFNELYPEYLFLLHTVIRASVPLMHDALDVIGSAGICDEVATGMASYLEHHIPEELGHDELLLQDLAELGWSRSSVLRRTPSPAVAAMVGSQYYWIRHHRPVALLGYIAVLEGYPPTAEEIDALVERSGLPRAAFRTMDVHAQVDEDHHRELYQLMDSMPLTAEDVNAICVSGTATVGFGITAMDEILSRPRLAPA